MLYSHLLPVSKLQRVENLWEEVGSEIWPLNLVAGKESSSTLSHNSFFSQNFHNGEPTNASPKDEKQFIPTLRRQQKTFFTSYDKSKQTLL